VQSKEPLRNPVYPIEDFILTTTAISYIRWQLTVNKKACHHLHQTAKDALMLSLPRQDAIDVMLFFQYIARLNIFMK